MVSGERAHDRGPDARSSPPNETIVASRVWTKAIRKVAPWRPGSQDPEDAIEDAAVIHPRHAARLIRQHRFDGSPFSIGKFVAHDSAPSSQGLKSWLDSQAQRAPTDGELVAMRLKAEV